MAMVMLCETHPLLQALARAAQYTVTLAHNLGKIQCAIVSAITNTRFFTQCSKTDSSSMLPHLFGSRLTFAYYNTVQKLPLDMSLMFVSAACRLQSWTTVMTAVCAHSQWGSINGWSRSGSSTGWWYDESSC